MKPNILAIIPARGGSKGVPKKNIKDLNGKPLIAYTIEAAKKSDSISRVIVSTESEEIANVSKKYGGEVPVLRPDSLAGDTSPTIDCVKYTLEYLKENENYYPDYVALLQCTSPLRNNTHVDECVEKLIESRADGIVSVCKAEHSPYWMKVIKNGNLDDFLEEGKNITRRQDLPDVYRLNGAMYIIKTDVLIEKNSFDIENTVAYVMDEYTSVDIDTKMDFKIAEILAKEIGDTNA